MALDFTKLGEVGTVDKVLDTDTVLVERGGSIYRVAGNQLGGAGGYLFEMDAASTTFEGGTFTNSQDVTDMVAAYQAGSNVVLKMPGSILDPESEGTFFMSLSMLSAGEMWGDVYAGMYIGSITAEDVAMILFTNGQPVPTSEASTTALRMKKGASDGKS